MATCNEHGVYQPDERLSLPRTLKGWRGADIANIKLADMGTHWIWANDYQMHGGDWSGSGSPLMDLAGSRAPSRQAAIEMASNEFRRRLTSRAARCKDAQAVLEWLDTLIPDQLDLFGAAA